MYKRILVIATLGLLGLCVGAALPQTAKQATPPVIPDALKAQFFKAQSQMLQAEEQANQKRQAFQQVVSSLTAACGTTFQPTMDPQGDPVCAAKPAEKEKK